MKRSSRSKARTRRALGAALAGILAGSTFALGCGQGAEANASGANPSEANGCNGPNGCGGEGGAGAAHEEAAPDEANGCNGPNGCAGEAEPEAGAKG